MKSFVFFTMVCNFVALVSSDSMEDQLFRLQQRMEHLEHVEQDMNCKVLLLIISAVVAWTLCCGSLLL